MAIGESVWNSVAPIRGVSIGVADAGVKYSDRMDVALVSINQGASVAGVFTQNAFAAAPVHLCRDYMSRVTARTFIINSGNANACTGDAGEQEAVAVCKAVAIKLDVQTEAVLPFSTGVIGEVLPGKKIIDALPKAVSNLAEDNWKAFAEAIMTTDTRPKGASLSVELGGENITISGVAKGAGMINPNMATMLGFVATDAGVEQSVLEEISKVAANKSFNRITIDGDTSTNDACMLIATGAANSETITSSDDPRYTVLLDAICHVYQSLAQQIVEDGEGATKFVTVDVVGGGNAAESLSVAYAIAHSPLVKTALFASDPNWGRIVAAIGYADIHHLDASAVRVWLDDVLIVEHGGRALSYTEEAGQQVLDKERFTIKVDLARGNAEELLWTSDLSHEYIRINAEYRS